MMSLLNFILDKGHVEIGCLHFFFNLLPHSALMCLNELELAREMVDLTRNSLFPSAKEMTLLSVMCPRPATGEPRSPVIEDKGESPDLSRPMTPDLKPRTKGVVLYLDSSNPEYEELLRERKKRRGEGERDFMQSNIVSEG